MSDAGQLELYRFIHLAALQGEIVVVQKPYTFNSLQGSNHAHIRTAVDTTVMISAFDVIVWLPWLQNETYASAPELYSTVPGMQCLAEFQHVPQVRALPWKHSAEEENQL